MTVSPSRVASTRRRAAQALYSTQESCNSRAVIEPKPAQLDAVDRRIVAALQADPRASWAQLAELVGVSETTVLRRVQRLRDSGVLVIVAAPDALRCGFGQPVLLRFRTVPGEATELAKCLAERADVRFVALLTGRSDVMCEIVVPDRNYLSRVLLDDIPSYGNVHSTRTEFVLKTFKTSDEWSRGLLDAEATPVARPATQPSPPEPGEKLDEMEMRLLAALGSDGRRSYADLSKELGLSETAIARRVTALTSTNRLYFVAMVDPAALGFELEVIVRLRVDLSRLESAAAELASLQPVRYVSATTGFSDLVFEGVFRDNGDMYKFLTQRLPQIDGIREVEVDVVLETVKRAFRYPLFQPALTNTDSPQAGSSSSSDGSAAQRGGPRVGKSGAASSKPARQRRKSGSGF
ncbi:MAG: asnC [Modestobacter sp.]|jgi:DNA-binding Lrp family transcriptional regulator|nr:asnC [Modestobacter sp.]